MTTNPPHYFSPRCKLEPSDLDHYHPSAPLTSTVSIASLQDARLREEAELGRRSPRAAVAGQFGELAIRSEGLPDSGRSITRRQQNPDQHYDSEMLAPDGYHVPKHIPPAWTVDSCEPDDIQDCQSLLGSKGQFPPNSASKVLSKSPSKKKTVTSPRKQFDPPSPSRNRRARLSPSLADVPLEDPYTWHDHEITGHNPTDPTDDGYGINGVGFRPTAATAWARSQRRQKQVAEWKSREAREAREERRQRRHEGVNMDRIRSIHKGRIRKRVKFDV